MLYAAIGPDSDVYVFSNRTGQLVCYTCSLTEDFLDHRTQSKEEMFSHLMTHMARGHRVPFDAIRRIRSEES